jgi:hypothetical protein
MLIPAKAHGFAALAGLPPSLVIAAEDREGNPIIFEEPAAKRLNPLGLAPLDSKVLARKRAGADTSNEMLLKGVVADNRSSNLSTGNNVISDGAFSGTVGFPMVIQNSGNSVLIQNATIVNVHVK